MSSVSVRVFTRAVGNWGTYGLQSGFTESERSECVKPGSNNKLRSDLVAKAEFFRDTVWCGNSCYPISCVRILSLVQNDFSGSYDILRLVNADPVSFYEADNCLPKEISFRLSSYHLCTSDCCGEKRSQSRGHDVPLHSV